MHSTGTTPATSLRCALSFAEIGSGPFPDVVESTLASLLEAGLEDASFQALKENLEGPSAGGSGRGAAAAAAALPAPGGFTSLFGVGGDGIGGGGGGVVAAVGAGAAAGVAPAGGLLGEEQLGAERCCLLNILTLIYYHPRCACMAAEWVGVFTCCAVGHFVCSLLLGRAAVYSPYLLAVRLRAPSCFASNPVPRCT